MQMFAGRPFFTARKERARYAIRGRLKQRAVDSRIIDRHFALVYGLGAAI